MLFTAYCLSYGNWTVIPKQWKESFMDMKDCGFDAVALSYSESEHRYARRTFEKQVKMAHDCGLKVIVVPSRILSRFAGAPLMPGIWICEHPEFQVPGSPGIACVDCKDVVEWGSNFIRELIEFYPVDGIIWDEPKGTRLLSSHTASIDRYGALPTEEQAMDSMADFLSSLTSTALAVRKDLVISLFNMPSVYPYFTMKAASIPGISYCGFDGSCCKQSYFHEIPVKFKPTINETWERTLKECRISGKKTFALIENMTMPAGVEEEFEMELSKFMSVNSPDHLSCYYYAHNNECPELVHKLTVNTIKKFLKK